MVEQLEQKVRDLPPVDNAEPRVSLTCRDWTLGDAVRFLADETGVSVVLQESLDDKSVTVDIVDEPISDVLQLIAKRVGVASNKNGNVYFVGTLSREDRGVLVRRASKLTAQDLSRTVEAFLSDNGTVSAFPDGVVIVGDRVDVLSRVDQLLNEIDQSTSRTWVVQYHVVSYSARAFRDFGFDVVGTGRVGAAFNSAQPGSNSSALAEASLEAVLRAAGDSSEVTVVAQPTVVVQDGTQGVVSLTEKRPYVNSSRRFENGLQSESVDIEFLDVGIDVETTVREASPTSVVFSSVISLSEQTGEQAGAPIVQSQSLQNSFVCKTDVVSLVGSIRRHRDAAGVPELLSWGESSSSSEEVVQVWCRVYAVE